MNTLQQKKLLVAEQPHPWDITLGRDDSDDAEIYQDILDLHIKGVLRDGDRISGFKSSSLTNVGYVAKVFRGEYDVTEAGEGADRLIHLTRVTPNLDANIVTALPRSARDLEDGLREHGYVLIRTGSPVDEGALLELLTANGRLMDYNRYGTTVRGKLDGSEAWQATPWAKELLLPAHNEMTHHMQFPKNVAFLCKEPATHGGETVIYDCARAFECLSPATQRKLRGRDVVCRKRYTEDTADLRHISWKQVLGAGARREDLHAHFTSMGYRCHDLDEVLEVHLTRPMVYRYAGQECLHASMVPLTPFWYWQVWPGETPPLMVTWDDGTPLSYEEFYELDEAVLSARVNYGGPRKHDVLVLDNLRIAHGRLPYAGERSTGGLMAQPAKFVRHGEEWGVEFMSHESSNE